MKIGVIQPTLAVYGGTRRIVETTNRLVERGHSVVIYHPKGTPCDWLKCHAETQPLAASSQQSHDVMIFGFPPLLKEARACHADLKIFYILELYRSDLLGQFSLQRLLRRRYWRERWLHHCLDGTFTLMSNATWMQAWVRERLDRECHLVIGGLNHDLFHPLPVGHVRKRGLLLTSGDSRSHKGFSTVQEAVEIISQQRSDVILDTYHGKNYPQEKMKEVYGSAEIFIDGQHHSGWNNPVFESMACGTPVVCTDIGGNGDFAFDDETALLVEPNNPKAMAKAICRMLDDPSLKDRLAASALKHVQQFAWPRTIDHLDKIIGGKKPRKPTVPDMSEFQTLLAQQQYNGKNPGIIYAPEKWHIENIQGVVSINCNGSVSSDIDTAVLNTAEAVRHDFHACVGLVTLFADAPRTLRHLFGRVGRRLLVATPTRDYHAPSGLESRPTCPTDWSLAQLRQAIRLAGLVGETRQVGSWIMAVIVK